MASCRLPRISDVLLRHTILASGGGAGKSPERRVAIPSVGAKLGTKANSAAGPNSQGASSGLARRREIDQDWTEATSSRRTPKKTAAAISAYRQEAVWAWT